MDKILHESPVNPTDSILDHLTRSQEEWTKDQLWDAAGLNQVLNTQILDGNMIRQKNSELLQRFDQSASLRTSYIDTTGFGSFSKNQGIWASGPTGI